MNQGKLWVMLDYNKRCYFLKNEFKRRILKSIKISQTLPYWRKYHSSYLTTKLSRNSARAILVNRCLVSGRKWSTTSKTNYSRFIFRAETLKAVIPGCNRASW